MLEKCKEKKIRRKGRVGAWKEPAWKRKREREERKKFS